MTEQETFDAAMKQVLSVSKAEMQRRLAEDKRTRDADPVSARVQAATKRPKRRSQF